MLGMTKCSHALCDGKLRGCMTRHNSGLWNFYYSVTPLQFSFIVSQTTNKRVQDLNKHHKYMIVSFFLFFLLANLGKL